VANTPSLDSYFIVVSVVARASPMTLSVPFSMKKNRSLSTSARHMRVELFRYGLLSHRKRALCQ